VDFTDSTTGMKGDLISLFIKGRDLLLFPLLKKEGRGDFDGFLNLVPKSINGD